MINKETLQRDLENIGLKRGDIVLAHISMKAIGWIELGEYALIHAFQDVIGKEGTLCLAGHSRCGPPWFKEPVKIWHGFETPIYGRTPQAMRLVPGVYRSIHPCVSMLAWGADAKRLVANHDYIGTPCGIGTPWYKLATEYGDHAKILRIGFHTTTMVDVAMDTVAPEKGLTPAYVTRVFLGASEPCNPDLQYWIDRPFRYCLPAHIRDARFHGINLPRLWKMLEPNTVSGKVGNCMSYITNAGQTYRILSEMAKETK